jgi:serine/threonine-protein kinase
MPLKIGDVIDRKYRITRLIGQGGMGAVYEGEHVLVERRVAIKVLRPLLERAQAEARFKQEARAAARIGNEHILDVYDMGTLADGSSYLVAEYLEGETLRERIRRVGRLDPRATVPLLLDLLDGLGAAHKAGIVHRDLKPDNVFLLRKRAGREDFVKLIDFGIARFEQLPSEDGPHMTATGAVLGTPHYLSPEQARGRRDVDARSDLFSVGIMLYEMVTGKVPYQAESFNDLLFQIALEPLIPPDQVVPGLDPVFARIIVKALAKDRADRFQSADEFARLLKCWAAGDAVELPPTAAVTVNEREPREPAAVPTPSTFGRSQAAEASPPAVRRRRFATRAIAGLAGVVVLLGVVAAVSLVRAPAPSAEQSAGARDVLTAPSGQGDHPIVVPVSAPQSGASSVPESGSATPNASVGAPRRRSALPQASQNSLSVPSTLPSAQPPRRRRDFGY